MIVGSIGMIGAKSFIILVDIGGVGVSPLGIRRWLQPSPLEC